MNDRILIVGQEDQAFTHVYEALLEAGFNPDFIDRSVKLDNRVAESGERAFTIICVMTEMDCNAIRSMRASHFQLIILSDAIKHDVFEANGWHCLQLQELASRPAKVLLKQLGKMYGLHINEDKRLTEVLDMEQVVFQSPLPMWIYDRRTYKFLYVNQAAINTYGYTATEFEGMTVKDIRPEEDIPQLVSNIQNKLGLRTWRHRKKSGEVFYVDVLACDLNYRQRDIALVTAIDVNDKVLAAEQNEQLLRTVNNQKERLDDLLTNMNEVVWQTRTDNFQLLYTNPACYKVYGYTPAEMMADPSIFLNSILIEDKDKFEASIRQALTEGKTESQFRIFHKDGSVKHLKGNAVLKKGNGHIPDTLSGLTIDITDMVRYQSELLAKSEELENILESITDGFCAIDRNWHFTYINKAFEKMFSIERSYSIGQNIWKVFPHLQQSGFYEDLLQAMENRALVQSEWHPLVSQKWFSISVYPTRHGLAIYFSDRTEERLLREKIEENERRLRALIDNTDDLIWSVDSGLLLTAANRSYIYTKQQFTGVYQRIGESVLNKLARTGKVDNWEQYYKRALKGEAFDIIEEYELNSVPKISETRFNPVHGDNDDIIGVSCFSRDITEIKKYLLKIEKQNERLREIAWIQSHKVRNHVAAIMGLVSLFNFEDIADISNAEALQHILNVAHELDNTIKDINDKTNAIDA
ncbi:PAS domain S-box protein [Niabella yanshanensis]|uniref:PAS domain S-box protein n=1 Tax=Niabella yanshanensis TaxID=577386 RepID=A0ABZ0WCA4_9BACT|nr:PAS domain-containing protein [Niabella yanshanensis]WQD39392.1 PAS domain S-box protein [Niabella yanshanensis]